MKILIVVLLVSLAVVAQAGGMYGGGQLHGGGGHAASALYAALAALGYWVLQHAAKETAGFVKRTGVVLGMTLVIIGLLGVLCGVGSHIGKNVSRSCLCPEQGMKMRGGPEGETPAMTESITLPGSAKKKTR